MKSLPKIVGFVALFVVVAGTVVLINQTLQLSMAAERLHPLAGQMVFWGLAFAYLACLITPVVLFMRLPSALVPPPSEDDPAFPKHLKDLHRRLVNNPHLENRPGESQEEILAALSTLSLKADEVIKGSASRIFLSTAI